MKIHRQLDHPPHPSRPTRVSPSDNGIHEIVHLLWRSQLSPQKTSYTPPTVAPRLPQVPGSQNFAPHNSLAYPFPAVTQRPRHPRQLGILRPPPLNASRQRRHPPFYGSLQPPPDMYATVEAHFTASSTMTSLSTDISLSGGGVLTVMYETHWSGLLSPSPPASRPLLLVWHPLTTPPVQPLIPKDALRGRSPRISADPGRNISRSRVQPRPTHPLASTLQLHDPPRGGTPLVQSPRRSLVVGQSSPSHLDRQFSRQLLYRPLPR